MPRLVIHKKTSLQDKLLLDWSAWCRLLKVVDKLGLFHNYFKHLQEDQKYKTNKEFNCVMVVNLRQRNNLQFQCFRDFNKCVRAIFSQLSFQNFWLYLLGEIVMTQKLLKMTQKKSHCSESP